MKNVFEAGVLTEGCINAYYLNVVTMDESLKAAAGTDQQNEKYV